MIFKVLLLLPLFTLGRSLPVNKNFIDEETEIIDSAEVENYIDLTDLSRNMYGKPDSKTGELLSKWTPDQLVNPEELGSYLEGDILFLPSNISRNGLIARSSRWNNGVVPYVIEGKFTSNELDTIRRGIEEYHSKTCIRFKPRTNERDYVAIVNDNSGCWSSVGRIGGRQEINLQTPGCLVKVGTFIHEAMHAIGFLHEQNRYERDNYVTIKWENIQSGTRNNFDKASSSSTSGYGVPYDYGSVMHYSAYAFTKNGQPTIIPKHAFGRNVMGQRNGFSENDVSKIRNMYDCKDGAQAGSEISTGNNGSPFINFLGNLINNFLNHREQEIRYYDNVFSL